MRGTLFQKGAWAFNVLVVIIGTFLCVAGTYATAQLIKDAYASGQIGRSSALSTLINCTNKSRSCLLLRR